MFAVVADFCGTVAWYGLYADMETAKKVAEKVNGRIVIWGT